MCKIFCKAINDGTIHLGSSHKKYIAILNELEESNLTVVSSKGKFDPDYPASHQEQKHEFIQFVPLSILLIGANKIAEIIKSIWQPFWRRWRPSKMGTLLSLYDGLNRILQGITDIEWRPFYKS